MTEKVVELCNDAGVIVEVRDIEACHRLSKKSKNSYTKELLFVNRAFAEDLLYKKIIVQH